MTAPPAWAAPLVTAQQRPQPPYDAGPEAADLGATAMIDISDGLLADLGHIAAASGVQIDVASARLAPGDALLTAARAVPAARRNAPLDLTDRGSPSAHSDALAWVLTGGEDHALAATFPPGTALPPRWTVIGEVREDLGGAWARRHRRPGQPRRHRRPGQHSRPPGGDGGVLVDGQAWAGPAGWDHFRPSG
jgi:thiamine-monophosphate kinase